ncbi:MAG: DUF2628 domain-containing protein [Salinarimonas sp.]|nr:DUF2628 domain-containing protein [Salinarimonas sp.]
MQVYTVHLPVHARPGDAEAFEKAVLVRDGFHVWAFLFTVLWFLYHRLWLAALGVFVALAVFGLTVDRLALAPLAGLGAHLLASALIGLEASSLKRWTYGRNGYALVDVVSGADEEEAEAKACARWLARGESGSDDTPPAPPSSFDWPRPGRADAPRRESGVIGLFPERSR